jgi:hypothetical protein
MEEAASVIPNSLDDLSGSSGSYETNQIQIMASATGNSPAR